MIHIKAPGQWKELTGRKLFLAGSIDMGNSIDWQAHAVDLLSDTDLVILNPRRDDWDSSWEQKFENDQFREQVEWEQDGIEQSDIVLFFFAPDSQSPITLLELGQVIGRNSVNQIVIVVCPEYFWRKGNIDIVCHHAGLLVYEELPEAIGHLKRHL